MQEGLGNFLQESLGNFLQGRDFLQESLGNFFCRSEIFGKREIRLPPVGLIELAAFLEQLLPEKKMFSYFSFVRGPANCYLTELSMQ